MSGIPLAAVAKYLGHSGAQMVMRYAHLVPEVNARAIEAVMSFYPKLGPSTDTTVSTGTSTSANAA